MLFLSLKPIYVCVFDLVLLIVTTPRPGMEKRIIILFYDFFNFVKPSNNFEKYTEQLLIFHMLQNCIAIQEIDRREGTNRTYYVLTNLMAKLTFTYYYCKNLSSDSGGRHSKSEVKIWTMEFARAEKYFFLCIIWNKYLSENYVNTVFI